MGALLLLPLCGSCQTRPHAAERLCVCMCACRVRADVSMLTRRTAVTSSHTDKVRFGSESTCTWISSICFRLFKCGSVLWLVFKWPPLVTGVCLSIWLRVAQRQRMQRKCECQLAGRFVLELVEQATEAKYSCLEIIYMRT